MLRFAGRRHQFEFLQPRQPLDLGLATAGTALVEAAGGHLFIPSSDELSFNRPHPKFPGLVAFAAGSESLWADEQFTLRDS